MVADQSALVRFGPAICSQKHIPETLVPLLWSCNTPFLPALMLDFAVSPHQPLMVPFGYTLRVPNWAGPICAEKERLKFGPISPLVRLES